MALGIGANKRLGTYGIRRPHLRAGDDKRFRMEFTTDGVGQTIVIPLINTGGTINFIINWGDPADPGDETVNTWNHANLSHTYASAAAYPVIIKGLEVGNIEGFKFNNGGSCLKLTNIYNWGLFKLSESHAFSGCSALEVTATDAPNVTTTSLADCFKNCTTLTNIGGEWNVSTITDMSSVFYNCTNFNGDISLWNVSNVINFTESFQSCTNFDQNIGSWVMTSCTTAYRMLRSCTNFNQNIGSWNTTLFAGGLAFKQILSGAAAFDQDLSAWDFRAATSLDAAFNSTAMSADNYDLLLNRLDSQTLTGTMAMGFAGLKWKKVGAKSRAKLLLDGHTITDAGTTDYAATDFIFTVTTTGGDQDFQLPLLASGTYSFNVDWGDGEDDDITVWNHADTNHDYEATNTFEVKITGTITGWQFNNSGSKLLIDNVANWGPCNINDGEGFYGCTNMEMLADDAPTISGTDLGNMFKSCTALGYAGDYSGWGTGSITDMHGMFYHSTTFNGDGLNSWDVEDVTAFEQFMLICPNFNRNISGWDPIAAINMSQMFDGCSKFNQDIRTWNVTNVTNMSWMFQNCTLFNNGGAYLDWGVKMLGTLNVSNMFNNCINFDAAIDNWRVDNVTNFYNTFKNCESMTSHSHATWNVSSATMFYGMYDGCTLWNQGCSGWNVTASTNFTRMFADSGFNQSIDNWTLNATGADIILTNMFSGASAYNQDMDSWDTSNVTLMTGMFFYAPNFDGDLTGWSLAKCTNISTMFYAAPAFTGTGLSGWNTSNVENMNQTFRIGTNFNADISGWNTSSVTNMNGLFYSCTNFNRDLSSWDIADVTDMANFGYQSGISAANWSSTLASWNAASHLDDLTLGGPTVALTAAGVIAKSEMVNNDGWTFTGDTGSDSFIFTVTTGAEDFVVPLEDDGITQNFVIDYGDGSGDKTISAWDDADLTHTYTAGTWTVEFKSIVRMSGWRSGGVWGDRTLMRNLYNWGNFQFSRDDTFQGCTYFNIIAVDAPIEMVWIPFPANNFKYVFKDCPALTGLGDVASWNFGHSTYIQSNFQNCTNFNVDLSGWAAASANWTATPSLFNNATSFNQNLNSWDWSKVQDAWGTFQAATAFQNGGVAPNWDLGHNIWFSYMFYSSNFNQSLANIEDWGLSDSTGATEAAFHNFMSYNTTFNQDISELVVSNLDPAYGFNSAFLGCTAWTTAQYDAALIAFDQVGTTTGVGFHAGTTKYTPGGAAEAARTSLDVARGWTFTDGGPV